VFVEYISIKVMLKSFPSFNSALISCHGDFEGTDLYVVLNWIGQKYYWSDIKWRSSWQNSSYM